MATERNYTDEIPEELARSILTKAVVTERAAELLVRLFDGDAVTLDAQTGELVFATKAQIEEFYRHVAQHITEEEGFEP